MAKVIGASTIPCPREAVLQSEEMIGKQLFLYEGGGGDTVHCLNGGAAIVWLLCDGEKDTSEIAKQISDEFELPGDQTLLEVQETIQRFKSLNLLDNRSIVH